MAAPRAVRGLSCDDTFRTAAGKVLWTRMEEMMSFADAALAGMDIEGVHDMRVGSRRMRAAMELFSPVFPRKKIQPLIRDVKRVADALGRVRDLDVMLERIQADCADRPREQRQVLEEMIDEMRSQRDGARRNLRSTLDALADDDFARRFMAVVALETV